MFRAFHRKAWVFDAEWVPDPSAGRKLYQLSPSLSDTEVLTAMWKAAGATPETPRPYLKTVVCKVVSIAAVTRTETDGDIKLHLLSLPRNTSDPDQIKEPNMIDTFLKAIGKHHPQLIGFNAEKADIRILIQRAVAHGLQAAEFCRRPAKPWEGIDYFARGGDQMIDLMVILGGWGRSVPSLHEMATVCGIPGKLNTRAEDVALLWLEGALDEIVAYNETDAISTYLLWLRTAHFAGFLSSDQYRIEQDLLAELLVREAQNNPRRAHLKAYLEAWRGE
jgi:3'-5' exonuclease